MHEVFGNSELCTCVPLSVIPQLVREDTDLFELCCGCSVCEWIVCCMLVAAGTKKRVNVNVQDETG